MKCIKADTYNENGNDLYYCPECGYLNVATIDQEISDAIDDNDTTNINSSDNSTDKEDRSDIDISTDNNNDNGMIFNELSTVVRQQSANRYNIIFTNATSMIIIVIDIIIVKGSMFRT